ncbi:hypothetical protein [Saccharopolyspora pogona]|uniref:hypothetical protein n=1 Tax=Saccharopolyspora pogona TaxID=333966 RepID=UPI0016884775|nr:hypothetical protein [Saccharopolyspora pogona]
MSGLRPETAMGRLSVAEVDSTSRLMGAAGPVLDELAIRLEGTTFCVALADSTCARRAGTVGRRGAARDGFRRDRGGLPRPGAGFGRGHAAALRRSRR